MLLRTRCIKCSANDYTCLLHGRYLRACTEGSMTLHRATINRGDN